MSADLPELDACGFVRVHADEALWMTCDACGKSDHFWMDHEAVHCRCGAHYDHALRPDGSRADLEALVFTPWAEGPVALADVEVDWRRLAPIAVAVVMGAGAAAWLLFAG